MVSFAAKRRHRVSLCCLISAIVFVLPATVGAEDDVLSIGTQKQLFIDDYIIESTEPGIFQILNRPQKYAGNPIIQMDRCWEATLGFTENLNLVYDREENVFKMWNGVVDYDWSEDFLGYFVSKNGIHWEKPFVGQFDYHSPECKGRPTRNHNFVAKGAGGVIKDLHEKDPQKRYKRLYGRPEPQKGTWAAYSPDGIHWTDYPHPEVNPVYLANDTHQAVFWDDRREEYVAHIRLWPPIFRGDPRMWAGTARGKGHLRVPGIATSRDFIHWQAPERMRDPVEVNENYILVPPDEKDTPATRGFYTMETLQYEGTYIAFLTPYHTYPGMERNMPPTRGNARNPWIDRIDIQLAFSRDGTHWRREAERRTFLPNGPEGSYDAGMIFVAQPPIVREDLGEIWIYYSGFRKGHWSSIRGETEESTINLAKLRLDGFVSLTGGKGFATTKALTFEGGRLRFNAITAGDEGAVHVEILDAKTNQPVSGYGKADCDRFQGNEIRHTASWKGRSDVSRLAGKPVKLRFYLERAKLFSFQFDQGG